MHRGRAVKIQQHREETDAWSCGSSPARSGSLDTVDLPRLFDAIELGRGDEWTWLQLG